MSTISRALMAHPAAPELAREERAAEARCIEACLETAQVCRIGADACVEEEAVAELRECLRAEQDCGVVCAATAQVLARLGFPEPGDGRAVLVPLLQACRAAARVCRDACRRHAEVYEHCALVAEACERCVEACEALLARRS
ncbi:four-helix bundle copper-binding protein [Kocuria sp. NPDC057446]|uniref:four-helix bundle copper-binding protein n=1 Tax=Kocuria sp. NPDC057446 TaxID=3346137 RepID=UPI0036A43D7D